jgi:hypothetical protein
LRGIVAQSPKFHPSAVLAEIFCAQNCFAKSSTAFHRTKDVGSGLLEKSKRISRVPDNQNGEIASERTEARFTGTQRERWYVSARRLERFVMYLFSERRGPLA